MAQFENEFLILVAWRAFLMVRAFAWMKMKSKTQNAQTLTKTNNIKYLTQMAFPSEFCLIVEYWLAPLYHIHFLLHSTDSLLVFFEFISVGIFLCLASQPTPLSKQPHPSPRQPNPPIKLQHHKQRH